MATTTSRVSRLSLPRQLISWHICRNVVRAPERNKFFEYLNKQCREDVPLKEKNVGNHRKVCPSSLPLQWKRPLSWSKISECSHKTRSDTCITSTKHEKWKYQMIAGWSWWWNDHIKKYYMWTKLSFSEECYNMQEHQISNAREWEYSHNYLESSIISFINIWLIKLVNLLLAT